MAQKFRPKKTFSGLPSFGLVAALTCFVALVPMWVVQIMQFRRRPSIRLLVRVLKPAVLSAKVKPLTEPVVIQLRFGVPRKLYLNSTLVSLSTLEAELKEQLKLRPNWVVYFDADPHLSWGDAAEVIDIIRGAGAEVVLLTPGSEKSSVR
jgi:biopolymer transport protein ExbD